MENEKIMDNVEEISAEVIEETVENAVEEIAEAEAEPVEEINEGSAAEAAPVYTTIAEVFSAMVKENDGEFPKESEKAAFRFSELAPELIREARLADVFFACGGSADLLAVKAAAASAQEEAVAAIVKEMKFEYWIDKAAAEAVCADFLSAIGAEPGEEEETICQLADRYFSGDGVPQDKDKAAELYHEAANKGDMVAQYTLAYMYDKGDGIDKDRDKAMLWYEKAAEQGHEAAQNRLGVLRNISAPAQSCSCEREEEPKKKKGFFCRK